MAIRGLVEQRFPRLESTIRDYICDVLQNGLADFESADDVYESVGEILSDIMTEEEGERTRELMAFCQQVVDIKDR